MINIGSGQMYSINDIVAYIKMVLPNTKWVYKDEKVFDTHHAKFNIDKLKSIIKFDNTEMIKAIESTYYWEKDKLN